MSLRLDGAGAKVGHFRRMVLGGRRDLRGKMRDLGEGRR